MMNVTHKTRSLAISLLIAALVLAGLNYWAFSFIQSENVHASELRADAAAFDERNAALFGTGQNDVVGQVGELRSHLLTEEASVSFLEKIEARAKELGVNFKINSVAIDPQTDDTKANVTENLRLNFEASGSWDAISELIFFVEHVPYRVIIENAALSRLQSAEPGARYAAAEWRLRADFIALKLK